MRRQALLGIGGVSLFVLLHGARHVPFVINVSASMPIGVYRKEASTTITRGSLVLVCPSSSRATELLTEGNHVVHGSGCGTSLAPIVKRVVAVPGDDVSVRSTGVWVRGDLLADSVPKTHRSSGEALTKAPSGKVPPGKVFLLGLSPESLDSRYFGPISTSDIKATLEQVY